MKTTDKAEMRRHLRRMRATPESRRQQSEDICRHIAQWPPYVQAETVAAYMPLPWEADVLPLADAALAAGKRLLLPRIEAPHVMTFRQIGSMDELIDGPYGLREPSPSAAVIAPEEIGLMLVPLEAIDASGRRLGKGGGYYDAILAAYRGVTLGVALAHQRVEEVPADAWDVPLQAVADAHGVHLFDKTLIR